MPILTALAIAALAAMASKKPGAQTPGTKAPVVGSGAGGGRFDLAAPEVRRYLDELARNQGVEPAALRAVIRVESGGKPYGPDGKLLLRFEPHVFARLTAQKKLGKRKLSKAEVAAHGAIVLNPGMKTIDKPRQRTGGQAGEYETLARASAIDPELALQASSFGLPQVMGFNHAALGFPGARAMFEAFQRSPLEQLRGMSNFIGSSSKMAAALKAKDWPAFVEVYNGAKRGSAENNAYRGRLVQNYQTEKAVSGMSGFPQRIPRRMLEARRLTAATDKDKQRLIRAAHQRRISAWMHSPKLRQARLANTRLSKVLGWRTKAGVLDGPGNKGLAIMLYRLQMVAGMTPTGRLGRKTVALLHRHMAKGTRLGRWANSVLYLQGMAGVGAAPTPSPAAQARSAKKKDEPGFFGRLGRGLMDKVDEVNKEKAEAAAQAAADRKAAARAAAARPSALFRPRPSLPAAFRPPGSSLFTARAVQPRTNYMPWAIAGGALLLALVMATSPRRNPASMPILAA